MEGEHSWWITLYMYTAAPVVLSTLLKVFTIWLCNERMEGWWKNYMVKSSISYWWVHTITVIKLLSFIIFCFVLFFVLFLFSNELTSPESCLARAQNFQTNATAISLLWIVPCQLFSNFNNKKTVGTVKP